MEVNHAKHEKSYSVLLTTTADVSSSTSVFWYIRKSTSLRPSGSATGSSILAAERDHHEREDEVAEF